MKLTDAQVSRLVDIIEKRGGKELRIETGNIVIYLKDQGSMEIYKLTPMELDLTESKTEAQDEGIISVTAPSAGIFYRRPEPEVQPYVEVGSIVEPGDTLGLIEVMKSFGPVVSQVKGKILKILAEDAKPVEYGQPLFLIKRFG
ncbi:MAG: hypothetical protein DRG39_07685 [Deltaproteobacteria bacterium]|nr:MAG: hypothetical protein DRG39_07685 [Deltaproteobacteria bacterium]